MHKSVNLSKTRGKKVDFQDDLDEEKSMGSSSFDGPQSPMQSIQMDKSRYEQMAGEFRCPICIEILVDPVWLPCMHVFCRRCVKTQVVCEKSREKLACCAECKQSFSHRNLRQNKRFDNILEIFKTFREDN